MHVHGYLSSTNVLLINVPRVASYCQVSLSHQGIHPLTRCSGAEKRLTVWIHDHCERCAYPPEYPAPFYHEPSPVVAYDHLDAWRGRANKGQLHHRLHTRYDDWMGVNATLQASPRLARLVSLPALPVQAQSPL